VVKDDFWKRFSALALVCGIWFVFGVGCATVAIDGNKQFIHTVGDSQAHTHPCVPPPDSCPVTPQPLCADVVGGTISNNAAMVIPAVFGAIVTAVVHAFVP